MKQFDKLQKSLRIIVAIVITVGALNLGYMSASQVSVSNDINLVDSNIQTLSTSTYSSGVYIDGKELDANLVTAILAYTGTGSWTSGVVPTTATELTKEKLADFKGNFAGSSYGIQDAYGVQYMVNAGNMYLPTNELTNINFLDGITELGWTQLRLNGNQISDISLLANITFPNLTQLYLGNGAAGNNISDISALALMSAPNLANLWLDSNPISDLTPLASFDSFTNLTTLYARYGDLTNITVFSGKTFDNMTTLYLQGNQISDISGLATASFPKLTTLTLGNGADVGNNISNISALGTMSAPNLVNLYLDSNPITSLAPLANFDGFTNLTGMWVRYGLCTFNLDAFAGKTFNNLTTLNVIRNNISDISGLATASFPTLATLQLGNGIANGNNISDISALATMNAPSLANLYLDNNPITQENFDQFASANIFKNLTVFFSNFNPLITNIDILENITFPNMTNFYMYGNSISNINSLATTNFPELTFLAFGVDTGGNDITDISPLILMEAPNLIDLNLSQNPIADLSPLLHEKFSQLESLYLNGINIVNLDSLAGINMSNLTLLRIRTNSLQNVAGLGNALDLSNLADLWLDKNQITDLSGLNTLDAPISSTAIYDNKISDLTPLYRFTDTLITVHVGEQIIEKTLQYTENTNGTITVDAPFILADGTFANYSNLSELNATLSNGKLTFPESVVTSGVVLILEETTEVGLSVQTTSSYPLSGTVTIDFVSEQEKGGYVSQSSSFIPTDGDFSVPQDYFYEDDLVEITTTTATGYTLSNVTITGDKTGANYSSLVEKTGNSFSFSMPSESVSISVTFAKVSSGGYITVTTDGNGNVFTSSAVHYDTSESVINVSITIPTFFSVTFLTLLNK